MFDNYPSNSSGSNQSNPANNLSKGSAPDDIFAEFENRNSSASKPLNKASLSSAPSMANNQQSSFASVKSPSTPNQTGPAYNQMPRPNIASMGSVPNRPGINQFPADSHSGSLKYLIIGVVTLLFLLGGSFYLYQFVLLPKLSNKNNVVSAENNNSNTDNTNNNENNSEEQTEQEVSDSGVNLNENNVTSSIDNTLVESNSATSTTTSTINNALDSNSAVTSTITSSSVTSTMEIAIDPNKDSDSDGLVDIKESEYGTNPNKFDTDDDGLGDYEEVEVWKTNPLNKDTDGDTYLDGAEVKSRYNPNGPGRITIKN